MRLICYNIEPIMRSQYNFNCNSTSDARFLFMEVNNIFEKYIKMSNNDNDFEEYKWTVITTTTWHESWIAERVNWLLSINSCVFIGIYEKIKISTFSWSFPFYFFCKDWQFFNFYNIILNNYFFKKKYIKIVFKIFNFFFSHFTPTKLFCVSHKKNERSTTRKTSQYHQKI